MQNYAMLGRSGLRVSPLGLGTMTFGTEWGWGSAESVAREIFNLYLESGGNLFDTADLYTNGTSEELLGKFVRERGVRDRAVIATKFTFNPQPGNPNAGGNGRKNMLRAIEGSLKRLQTDYIDLYWVHAWDTFTPVEEVMSGLDSLVQSGKVRYIGLSDCPAWYVSRAQTLAELRGWEKIAAIQMEYNLTDRSIEFEYVPMVQELGIGINVWSPLAGGLLTGKHSKASLAEGRLKTAQGSGNPVFDRITARPKNWEIVEVLNSVAREMGRPAAEVALNWITKRAGISSTLVGASKVEQLKSSLGALDFEIPAELSLKLEHVSAPEECTPYMFYGESMRGMVTGGATVTRENSWYRTR
jgi:aryl-alcohol dehydrogenase-like predicted oxidoreductase